MSFAPLNILPNEHYISWFVRQAHFQAFPNTTHFLSKNGIVSTSLKAYDVLHESIVGFLAIYSDQVDAICDHTLLPFWQLSVEKVLTPDDFINGGFLDIHHSSDEKTVFQFDRSWHSCPKCREEDIASYGSSYWHSKHQIPSVYKCFKHKAILEKAYNPIHDLRTGTLPHQVKHWHKLVSIENEDVSNWNNFINTMVEKSTTEPESLLGLKTKVHQVLGVDNMSVHQCLAYTDELTPRFESKLGIDLLSYLFKDYARTSNKGKPRILRSLFARLGNPYKIRSPIYWLLLGYWLFPDELTI